MLNRIKKYKIKQKDIAKYFKYSSNQSFCASSAKERILSGVDKIIEHIENQLINKLKE